MDSDDPQRGFQRDDTIPQQLSDDQPPSQPAQEQPDSSHAGNSPRRPRDSWILAMTRNESSSAVPPLEDEQHFDDNRVNVPESLSPIGKDNLGRTKRINMSGDIRPSSIPENRPASASKLAKEEVEQHPGAVAMQGKALPSKKVPVGSTSKELDSDRTVTAARLSTARRERSITTSVIVDAAIEAPHSGGKVKPKVSSRPPVPGAFSVHESMTESHPKMSQQATGPSPSQLSSATSASQLRQDMMQRVSHPSLDDFVEKMDEKAHLDKKLEDAVRRKSAEMEDRTPVESALLRDLAIRRKSAELEDLTPVESALARDSAIRRKSKELEDLSPSEFDLEAGVMAYLAPSEPGGHRTSETVRTTAAVSSTRDNGATNLVPEIDIVEGDIPDESATPVVVEGVTTISLQRSNARKNHYRSSSVVALVLLVVALFVFFGGRDKSKSDPPGEGGEVVPLAPVTMKPGASGVTPTTSPTHAPTSIQFQMVVEEIARQFPDQTTRQAQNYSSSAVQWLALNDTFPFEYPLDTSDVSTQLHFRQRFTLATIFFATGGRMDGFTAGTWKDPCNFLSAQHVCEWQCPFPAEITPSTYALTTSTIMGVQCGQAFALDTNLQEFVVSVELGTFKKKAMPSNKHT
jgi:hypothetical protein